MTNKQDQREAIDQESLIEDLAVNQHETGEVKGGTQLGRPKYELIEVPDLR